MLNAADLDAAGLGLAYGWVELVSVPPEWVDIGGRLADELATSLGGLAIGVAHIGSTSVAGLLAKPIIDVAIGTTPHADVTAIVDHLAEHQWIYRGDAGDQGGHVFALESRAWHRVAHAHVVEHGAEQWRAYLSLRATLRSSEDARQRYADEKQRLIAEVGRDNSAGVYTDGKSSVVAELLR